MFVFYVILPYIYSQRLIALNQVIFQSCHKSRVQSRNLGLIWQSERHARMVGTVDEIKVKGTKLYPLHEEWHEGAHEVHALLF